MEKLRMLLSKLKILPKILQKSLKKLGDEPNYILDNVEIQ